MVIKAQTLHKEVAYGGTIAVGSSIIKLWTNIQKDLEPYRVVNHGFGGSRTWEMLHFTDKLVTQFSPKVVLVYCGSNDINAGEQAEPIAARLKTFMVYISEAIGDGVEVVYIAINKAPQKRDRWDIVEKANALVKAEIEKVDTWHFVDVNAGMFDEEGEPRSGMFTSDGLHLHEKAYTEVWKPVVSEKLAEVWGRI